MNNMKPLTQEQIDQIRPKLIKDGIPVRFQENGQTCNIETGAKQPKGINVMYQLVYWNFTKEVAKEIAKLTGTKLIFSE
jgi:Flp pilus assembly protein TadG